MTHKPRKRFGQHFWHDQNTLRKTIDSLAIQPDDHLVEIGPGQGALTDYLVASKAKLDLIELDRNLVEYLETRYHDQPQVTIHSADALKFSFEELFHGTSQLRLVGNLPFNISTPLMFHVFACSEIIQDMTFLLQNEVVDRLCARPCTKEYGRLSVLSQYYCEVEKLFTVAPGCFNPPPKVFSAVVRLLPRQGSRDIDPRELNQLVTTAFSYRRKRISNALKGVFSKEELYEAGINPETRADQISVEQYLKLVSVLQSA